MKASFSSGVCSLLLMLQAALCLPSVGQEARSPATKLRAHEWGTFTQISGSDGSVIPWWNALSEGAAELPEFVASNRFAFAKVGPGQLYTLRMETPVIYFYPDRSMDVEVKAGMLNGGLTEWFPLPMVDKHKNWPRGSTDEPNAWKLTLLPPDSQEKDLIPFVGTQGAHYAHAREVPDAWLVKGHADHLIVDPAKPRPPQVDKLLFYRGAGQGSLPLIVQADDKNDKLTLTNSSLQPIGGIFVIRVVKGELGWSSVADMPARSTDSNQPAPKSTVTLPAPAPDADETALAKALENALTTAGLHTAEARAMVATWRDSWLKEDGVRILSLMPESWVNQTLPLTITPIPSELRRVFVARNEVLPPQTEKTLLTLLNGEQSIETAAPQLKALGLGRFQNAATERALQLQEMHMRNRMFQMQDLLRHQARKSSDQVSR